MYDTFITKKISKQLKGIAICLMVIHHLFGFPDRISSVSYTSLKLINGIPIEYYLGVFGKICVSIFLFLSGYGLFTTYTKIDLTFKSIFMRILSFYKIYWTVFLVFIGYGFIAKILEFNLQEFSLSLIGFSSKYNGEWWFIQVYIFFLLLYPIIMKIITRLKLFSSLIVTLGIFLVGLILTKINITLDIRIISIIGVLLVHQIYFILGILVSKYSLFDQLKSKSLNFTNNNVKNLITIIFLTIIYFIINNLPIIENFAFLIIMPIFIYVVAHLIKNSKIMLFIGKHSTNIWLTHSFFCYYYFQNFSYSPNFSILILIWVLFLSIFSSVIINKLMNGIKYYFDNHRKEVGECNKELREA